jgi:GNAT superfamily N-acetyltransferase
MNPPVDFESAILEAHSRMKLSSERSTHAIRRLSRDDALSLLPQLSEISAAAFSGPPWCLSGKQAAPLEQILQHDVCVFTAGAKEIEGFAVGTLLSQASIDAYCSFRNANAGCGDYHLTWRAVHPAFRKRGIGAMLLDCRIEHAVQFRSRAVYGHTDQLNYGTRRLLLSRGFVECERIPVLGGGRFTSRIFYKKELIHG